MKILALFAFVAFATAQILPQNFDVRTKWPGCTQEILNQQNCGSCWSFCSAESFTDRMCITGETNQTTLMSMEPILDCSIEGCGGGFPKTAWHYMIHSGTTTCSYSKQCFAGCQPYDSGSGTSPKCHAGTCDDGSLWPQTYYGGAFETLQNGNISLFMTELYNNGPLQACFNVYENFYTFFDATPTQVYTTYSGNLVGGHCVKLIGWGTMNGEDYWLYANSWDTNWGDKGFFRMSRGKNLCNNENEMSEGFTPKQAQALSKKGINAKEDSMLVGGWHVQTPTFAAAAAPAHFAIEAVSELRQQKLTLLNIKHVETQVVAGLNFKILMSVRDSIGSVRDLNVKVYKNLQGEFKLISQEIL